jgi:hypothetical protein
VIHQLPEEELSQSRLAIRSEHHDGSAFFLGSCEKSSRLQTLDRLRELGVTFRLTRFGDLTVQSARIDLHLRQP